MAEENEPQDAADSQETGEDADYKALAEKLQADLDKVRANSRKWESRSKANAEKAKLYDEASDKAATVEERLAKLEDENKALKAQRGRAQAVSKAAKATGVDEALVGMLSGSDEKELTAQAKAFAAAMKTAGYPVVPDEGPHGSAGGLTEEDVANIKNPSERVRARARLIHERKAR